MGRHKANKPRGNGEQQGGEPMRYADDGEAFEGNPTIFINAAPRSPKEVLGSAPALCLARWGELEWYAPVESVAETARDLAGCAAYADIITTLLRHGFEGHVVTGMVSEMIPSLLNGRRPVMGGMLGNVNTIGVMPGGSSARAAGVVMLKRGPLAGSVSPEGARQMAQHWSDAATISRHDELVGAAMHDLLGEQVGSKFGAVLEYMAAMRERQGPDLEAFRRDEAERLRLIVGAPAEG